MAVARKPMPNKPAAPIAAPAALPPHVEPTLIPPPAAAKIEEAAAGVETVLRKSADQTITTAREAHETFRKAVEQSFAQSRATYDKMKDAAEKATSSLETSYAAASKGVTDFNARTIDLMKAQSDAMLDHLKAVMSAKSVSEAITLQTAHARKQFETLTAQTKEMADLARKIATETAEPIKESLTSAFAA